MQDRKDFGQCCSNSRIMGGEQCRMHRGISRRWRDAMPRQRKSCCLWLGHVNVLTYMFMVANLNWRLIANLYNAFSGSLRNHQQESNGGYFVYSATTTMWFTVPVRQISQMLCPGLIKQNQRIVAVRLRT